MNSLCNSFDTRSLKPLILRTDFHFSQSLLLNNFPSNLKNKLALKLKPFSSQCCIKASSANYAATFEIDMVRNKQGIYTQKQSNKVVVLWDLDNKPPRGPPYDAAISLRRVAEKFGEVMDISAYANRHAFIHLPQWVIEERRERKSLDILERKGVVTSDPYICGVCGRKCKNNLDLKKHFKQLHERERQKKLNRMRSLKGKKRQKYKERYISGNEKYNEAARNLLKPKIGYGLGSELRRAGVSVKTVKDKPQAADWALKRQMQHSMSRGIDWIFLVSDDKDFREMLRKAQEANLGTVVVGDSNRGLGQHADLWVPWIGVENGELTEKDLVPRRRSRSNGDSESDDNGLFTVTEFDTGVGFGSETDLDSVVNELVAGRTEFGGARISMFSEGEEEEEDEDWVSEGVDEDYLLEDEETEDGYFRFKQMC